MATLAERAGVSDSYIARLENQQKKKPSAVVIDKLAHALASDHDDSNSIYTDYLQQLTEANNHDFATKIFNAFEELAHKVEDDNTILPLPSESRSPIHGLERIVSSRYSDDDLNMIDKVKSLDETGLSIFNDVLSSLLKHHRKPTPLNKK